MSLLTWTQILLLLSPLVLVPLGLRLATRPGHGPASPLLVRCARWAPLPAVSAVVAFVPEPGWVAAMLSLPWLAFTTLVATLGLGRFASRPPSLQPAMGIDVAMVYLAVGGIWLTISRGGWQPLDFTDPIVELTAVHFHYAGFALPLVAGIVATRLGRSVVVPFAVAIGVPLTALGVTMGGTVEWAAATVMALAGLGVAMYLLRLGVDSSGWVAARVALILAGISLTAGMVLALGWAWSVQFGWNYLGLDGMARTHGSLNALGFGLIGLVALTLLPSAGTTDRAIGVHLGRVSKERIAQLVEAAEPQAPTSSDLIDRELPPGYQAVRRVEHLHGDRFDDVARAIKGWHGQIAAGLTLHPTIPPMVAGTTMGLVATMGPMSVSVTCRIVEVIDEADRSGFVYATLPHHPEDGEERFLVTRNPDGTCTVEIAAVWRPAMVGSAVALPLTRAIQRHYVNRYMDGFTRPSERQPA